VSVPALARRARGAIGLRGRIVAVMAPQRHVSQADAAKRFDPRQARATQTKNQAIGTAENAAAKAADTASTGSYLVFGVLLLDLVAAAVGGSLAVQRRTLVTERAGFG